MKTNSETHYNDNFNMMWTQQWFMYLTRYWCSKQTYDQPYDLLQADLKAYSETVQKGHSTIISCICVMWLSQLPRPSNRVAGALQLEVNVTY